MTDGLEVFLICDALDECVERELLITFISDISLGKCDNIRLLATSRREHDIDTAIKPLCEASISIQDANIEADSGHLSDA